MQMIFMLHSDIKLGFCFGSLFWPLHMLLYIRGTIKIMIDRMGPFRMVVGVEAAMALHSLILASWMLLKMQYNASLVSLATMFRSGDIQRQLIVTLHLGVCLSSMYFPYHYKPRN